MQNINFEDLPNDFYFKNENETTIRAVCEPEKNGYRLMAGNDMLGYTPAYALENKLKDGTWKFVHIPKSDPIKPEHYHKGGIDVIGFSEKQFSQDELKGFYRINCLKYITRYDRKGGLTDLKKADFYLGKLMEMEGTE